MTARHTIALVAARELRARGKVAAVIAAIMVAVIVGGIAVVASATDPGAPVSIAPEDSDELVAFLGTMVLFMAIIFTGQVILLGVVEEKNSRVVEVLLGAVQARHLLAGKILAIGLLGLGNVLAIAVAVVVAGSAFGAVEIPSATGKAAAVVLFWFVLGFALYATVYAAAGAMVVRSENAANAAMPITLALLIGYFIAMTSIESPDNPLLRVASLLPPIAPLTMPIRMINGTVSAWEVVLAAALTGVTAYGLVRLAGRVYRGGVMQTARTGWRKAFMSAERAES